MRGLRFGKFQAPSPIAKRFATSQNTFLTRNINDVNGVVLDHMKLPVDSYSLYSAVPNREKGLGYDFSISTWESYLTKTLQENILNRVAFRIVK